MAICQNAPDNEGRGSNQVDAIALAEGGSGLRTTMTIASSSVCVTSLKVRTTSTETFRSRIERSLRNEVAEGTPGRERLGEDGHDGSGTWVREHHELSAERADHSRHASAVKRRKISSRVSK